MNVQRETFTQAWGRSLPTAFEFVTTHPGATIVGVEHDEAGGTVTYAYTLAGEAEAAQEEMRQQHRHGESHPPTYRRSPELQDCGPRFGWKISAYGPPPSYANMRAQELGVEGDGKQSLLGPEEE